MTSSSFSAAFADAGGVPPSKQAALLLHRVGPGDRRWLLGQLGPTARLELTGLLAELDGLGMAPAFDRVRAAAPVRPPMTRALPARQPLSIEAMAEEVMAAPIRQVIQQLHDEPDVVIGCVLRRAESGWTQRCLGGLDADRRRRLERGLKSDESASVANPLSLDRAVLQALLMRLAEAAEQSPLDRLADWKSRACTIVGGWLGRHAGSPTVSGRPE